MASNKINVPGGFGGLVRYNEEYPSRLKLKPAQVIVAIIIVIVLVTILKIFWPLAG